MSYITKSLRKALLGESVDSLNPIKFNPTTYIDLDYNFSGTLNVERNTKGTEYFGSRFGQDIEPKGYYCMQRENTMADDWPNYEFRTVGIRKPVVIQISDDTRIKWKADLSQMFGGLTGKRLSNKLIKLGYDAIITVDSGGHTWEMVLFN